MPAARVAAPAKINLILHVGPRDASGFHDIFTVFQMVDLADEVVIHVGGSGRTLDIAGPRVPASGLGPPEKNLAWRAAAAYAERTGWPGSFAIELTKNIPVGGGLGGGSSDAAAVLRALDTLAPTPVSQDVFGALLASLGSDVPFFGYGRTSAVGFGRGEMLVALPDPRPRDVMLAVPRFGIPTSDAYRWLDEAGARPWPVGLELALDTPVSEWPGLSEWTLDRPHNDFEPVVEARHPELRILRERLRESGASVARLSGSGSTVFGVFDGAAPSDRVLALDADIIRTRTSERVVPVEVLE